MHARQFLFKIPKGNSDGKEAQFLFLFGYITQTKDEVGRDSEERDEEKETNFQFAQQNPSKEWNRGRFIQM